MLLINTKIYMFHNINANKMQNRLRSGSYNAAKIKFFLSVLFYQLMHRGVNTTQHEHCSNASFIDNTFKRSLLRL